MDQQKLTDLQNQINSLQSQLSSFVNNMDFDLHDHNGFNGNRINLFDVFGNIETITYIPTGKPLTFYDQFKIYKSGSDIRLYWYDFVNNAWQYSNNVPGLYVATVSSAPNTAPTSIYDQFRVYTNGTTFRFYWYDVTNTTWHYVTATA